MNSKMFYKALAGIYDLLDVIYFRVEANSPSDYYGAAEPPVRCGVSH